MTDGMHRNFGKALGSRSGDGRQIGYRRKDFETANRMPRTGTGIGIVTIDGNACINAAPDGVCQFDRQPLDPRHRTSQEATV
ncbi:hypothetical protein [Sphingomonas sp. BK036]|uniref:hypothetical protein n=1 Tax=Sphingomonas sp. BK036 TaxID=2512122 RepID=UPI0013EEC4AA|nr:hypothetical protein [Sphingomonas sp. BK036]